MGWFIRQHFFIFLRIRFWERSYCSQRGTSEKKWCTSIVARVLTPLHLETMSGKSLLEISIGRGFGAVKGLTRNRPNSVIVFYTILESSHGRGCTFCAKDSLGD